MSERRAVTLANAWAYRAAVYPVPARPQERREQKNWSRVRESVGYYRYDSAELKVLNKIWVLDQTFTNYWLLQQRLVFKQRHGAKLTKRYDTATTPYPRAARHHGVDAVVKQVIHTIYN